ncbi:unnamed protein product [Ixodes persulcatus]
MRGTVAVTVHGGGKQIMAKLPGGVVCTLLPVSYCFCSFLRAPSE